MPGLRSLYGGLYVGCDGFVDLRQTNNGGGRCNMQVNEYKPMLWHFAVTGVLMQVQTWRENNRPNISGRCKIIRVPCSMQSQSDFILRAFQRGADGVIICGCHPGDCHYTSGNYYTRRRMALLFRCSIISESKRSEHALNG